MAHSKTYYAEVFRKYSIQRNEKGIQININFTPIGNLLDKAQFALDTQVWADMQKYMPTRGGEGVETLVGSTNALNQISAGTGEVHIYDPRIPYAHYQYMGEKYIDPVYRVGGFYGILEGKEGQWWSRRGVTKVPSGEPLKYTNPMAISLWDAEAIEQHGDEWLNLVKRILEGG